MKILFLFDKNVFDLFHRDLSFWARIILFLLFLKPRNFNELNINLHREIVTLKFKFLKL